MTYADVNGIKLYYDIQGTGRPLILLHGGLGAMRCSAPTFRRLPNTGR
jgi:pimeloyl-ACP methyl ester carboxylesterase